MCIIVQYVLNWSMNTIDLLPVHEVTRNCIDSEVGSGGGGHQSRRSQHPSLARPPRPRSLAVHSTRPLARTFGNHYPLAERTTLKPLAVTVVSSSKHGSFALPRRLGPLQLCSARLDVSSPRSILYSRFRRASRYRFRFLLICKKMK